MLEPLEEAGSSAGAVYQHRLGTSVQEDSIAFRVDETDNIRLTLLAGPHFLFVLVYRFLDPKTRDVYLLPFNAASPSKPILAGLEYTFVPRFTGEQIFVLTNQNAPNYRIAELHLQPDGTHELIEVVPERDAMIRQWSLHRAYIVVCYLLGTTFKIVIFDFSGTELGEIPLGQGETVRLLPGDSQSDEVLWETESFTQSSSIHRYSIATGTLNPFFEARIQLDSVLYTHKQICYDSKDGTAVSMFLVGRRDVLERTHNPAVLISYGGFRRAMTPQFTAFAAFLMEHGCVFAFPNIRGGAEFGAEWYEAARRRNRQIAFDDFLSAAEWLIKSTLVAPDKLSILGGSNSGLLVGVALTQAPTVFRAVICMAPLLDMLRYHLFDGAVKWREEFGTSDNPHDFHVLQSYSPYHNVSSNTTYPAVMMISGDSDQNCNPLHARKMVARLQSANDCRHPIILDYNEKRGHVPVLPLSTRINALTDRIAFLCDQLELKV